MYFVKLGSSWAGTGNNNTSLHGFNYTYTWTLTQKVGPTSDFIYGHGLRPIGFKLNQLIYMI